MPKRMLIDASHPEETRVVVLDGHKVEEFDFEAASKRPLKGNIYLAKVTRVEPSLQAAFVEYGGNRQGFLAFAEIHPDYYQIPIADRQALLAEQEAEARRRQEDDIESFEITPGPKPSSGEDEEEEIPEDPSGEESVEVEAIEETETAEAETVEEPESAGEEPGEPYLHAGADELPAEDWAEPETGAEDSDDAALPEAHDEEASAEPARPEDHGEGAPASEGEPAQALQAQRPSQRWVRRRHYKIQEVIKRRQIILVQVVKEERGNKGAALTTYLSLAGRYCVLMPNTPRGGGISRKITNANDRKRLKSAAQALELPEGMGLIVRTAGAGRTKAEIKRDYEYLLRMWDTIRELTLKSNAPACVYEEGDLIKRAIRDLYNKDVSEILVEGEEGYRNAKDFMRMLMPSHAKNVKPFKEAVPLFQRFQIEAQLDAMFQPTVTLKSGGYIVINQTEALVSIDVNSGRATREHSIEETATKTNLEAADEIGRQLRLRDLAGLIVIDFIDMEDGRNDRAVEKRLHNAVKNDRARIQIGKISQFGLLEMSRQRLRAGVIAGSTVPCPHCGGQGIVRSVESTALRVLRGIEEEAQRRRAEGLAVRVAADVAIYTLNQKRRELARLESEYDIAINFEPKEDLMAGSFEIERIGQRNPEDRPRPLPPPPDSFAAEPGEPEIEEPVEEEDEDGEETESEASAEERPAHDDQPREGGRRRRRRRRRGGRERSDHPNGFQNGEDRAAPGEVEPHHQEAGEAPSFANAPSNPVIGPDGQPHAEGEGRKRRRRRRGRRGGRGREHFAGEGQQQDAPHNAAAPAPVAAPGEHDRFGHPAEEVDTTPREEHRPVEPNTASTPLWSFEAEPDTTPVPERTPRADEPAQPVKKGWWQRAFKS